MSLLVAILMFSLHGFLKHSCIFGDHMHALKLRGDQTKIKDLPPTENGKPLIIGVDVNVRNILDVDEIKQLISLETSLKFYWPDPRISVDQRKIQDKKYVTLNSEEYSRFWIPDIFIDQAKDLRDPTFYRKPASFRVYNNGTMRFASRVNYDVACNMDFKRFPVDTQECKIAYESFSYKVDEIQFEWRKIDKNKDISLSQFRHVISEDGSYSTDYYGKGDSYAGFKLNIRLTRNIGYHLVQTYIPSTLFVILAYLSIYIPTDSIPARVGMGMTTLLTLTTMFSSVRSKVPHVSYLTYLDYWMLLCMLFVCVSIGEFIIAIILTKEGKDEKFVAKVRKIFKIVLPLAFILSNVVYWPYIFLAGGGKVEETS